MLQSTYVHSMLQLRVSVKQDLICLIKDVIIHKLWKPVNDNGT